MPFVPTRPPMIFISYRISDSLDVVARLAGDLIAHFGPDSVFRDRDSLQGGQDWPKELREEAEGCAVMLVVIGKTWQEARIETGRRKGYPRLSDPSDWVRNEIRAGLDKAKLVIPVLVHNATIPEAEWLEDCGLKELSDKQPIALRTDLDYRNDFRELTKLIEKFVPPIHPPPPPPPPPSTLR